MSKTTTMPFSAEAEEHVIACCLLDGNDTIARSLASGLTPEHFYDPRNRLLFETVCNLHEAYDVVTVEVLAEELKAGDKLDEAGGLAHLMQVTGKVPTSAHVGYFINKVKDLRARREVIKTANAIAEECRGTGSLEEMLGKMRAKFDAIDEANSDVTVAERLDSFSSPPDDDPDTLLGNRYLNRGDGMLLVSSSGMGKSSLTLQAAATWALGLSFFGITPARPLKSVVIQAEDSRGDIGEVWDSIKFGLKLTPEESNRVGDNVRLVNERVRRGDALVNLLRGLIRRHKPDLVWINPLLSFMKGDVNDAEDCSNFLRAGLNAINLPASFGYIIVHHTPKPPANTKDKAERKWNEVMYDGAGSHELTNWARAIITLKALPVKGDFNLMLAKRGGRAGVVNTVVDGAGVEHFETADTIPVKHSTTRIKVAGRKHNMPAVYWEYRQPENETPEPDEEREERRPGTGSERQLAKMLTYYPASTTEAFDNLVSVIAATKATGDFTARECRELAETLSSLGLLQRDPETKGYRRTAAGDTEADNFNKLIK